MLLKTINGVV